VSNGAAKSACKPKARQEALCDGHDQVSHTPASGTLLDYDLAAQSSQGGETVEYRQIMAYYVESEFLMANHLDAP
jgi:hypothetical protein